MWMDGYSGLLLVREARDSLDESIVIIPAELNFTMTLCLASRCTPSALFQLSFMSYALMPLLPISSCP
ncbi:hypothetical protein CVCC1112_716 [Paenarthrobacter nicotinovorans]|nr:hypothetical protein CVCC1112_716 [Paenarthrobacter nicotinovorans]